MLEGWARAQRSSDFSPSTIRTRRAVVIKLLDLDLDLDIGAVALEGLLFLPDAGYSFLWHPGQHPLNRADHLYGIPVAAV